MRAPKNIHRFKLVRERTEEKIPTVTVKNSSEIAAALREVHRQEGNDFQEFFYIVFLNRANRITGYNVASMGGVTGTVADPRLIIKAAALADCTSLVLCHNHPSGALNPSRQDEQLTSKIKQGCLYFDINVIDHIILSEDGFYSFADEGII